MPLIPQQRASLLVIARLLQLEALLGQQHVYSKQACQLGIQHFSNRNIKLTNGHGQHEGGADAVDDPEALGEELELEVREIDNHVLVGVVDVEAEDGVGELADHHIDGLGEEEHGVEAVVARPGVDGHADHVQAGAEAEVGGLVGEVRHEADEQEQQAGVGDEAEREALQQAGALGLHCSICN